MIQTKLFNKIKKALKEKYKFDMTTADVRVAYVVYNFYMQEYHDIIDMRKVLHETHSEYIDKSVSYISFERAIYRSLEKIRVDNEKYINIIIRLVEDIFE